MPNTPNLSLPYPALSSAPNVPQDLQALAAALDTILGAQVRTPPSILLTKSQATIANNSQVTVNWTAAPRNPSTMWAAGTPSVVTIPYTGLWAIQYVVRWASQTTAAGYRQARIDVNGVETALIYAPTTTGLNGTNIPVYVTYPVLLAAGDQITTSVYQNSGGTLDILASTRLLLTMISS